MRTFYVVDLEADRTFEDFEQVYYIRTIGSDDAEVVLVRASEVPKDTPVYTSRREANEDLQHWRALDSRPR